jgi:hypothetical protein
MPDEPEVPETPPEDGSPSPAARNALKAMVKEAIAEFAEENKPAPQRTKRSPNFLDQIFGM